MGAPEKGHEKIMRVERVTYVILEPADTPGTEWEQTAIPWLARPAMLTPEAIRVEIGDYTHTPGLVVSEVAVSGHLTRKDGSLGRYESVKFHGVYPESRDSWPAWLKAVVQVAEAQLQ